MDRFDADAVCAECGTVNPEDTLICKVCGNNLRDQRARRMAKETGAQLPTAQGHPGRTWVSGVLVALGLLLVLWVALNAEHLARGMIEAMGEDQGYSLGLWSGEEGARLDALSESLDAATPDLDAQMVAIRDSAVVEEYAGLYVITQESTAEGMRPRGLALVQKDEDGKYYFVGHTKLVKVRGTAHIEKENGWLMVDRAGYREGTRERLVHGAAMKLPEGGIECYGEAEMQPEAAAAAAQETTREGYTFYAFKLVDGAQ
ncbi:MAG: hypothetical protein ACLFTT_06055 [Candidatus Hydrogenedentota bacterium]